MGGILSVSNDPMDRVLAGLSAESRALLELSVRRGIPDDEIAELLGTTESGVRTRRESVLQEVADSLGAEPDAELREQMADHLGDRGNLFAAPPEPPEEPRRRGRLVPALIGGVLIAAAAALVLALVGGRDNPPKRRTLQLGPTAQLEPLPGMPPARARARLVQRAGRDRLELRVAGLPRPRGRYTVWLYNSVADAKALGSFPAGDIELDAPLPSDFERYRDVDVSLEPANGNPNHSGDSFLRAPLARLRP